MTDAELKIRGLCETLASACASAAACHRALAGLLPQEHPFQEVHRFCAATFDGYEVDRMAAEHIAALSLGSIDAAWPDALERPTEVAA